MNSLKNLSRMLFGFGKRGPSSKTTAAKMQQKHGEKIESTSLTSFLINDGTTTIHVYNVPAPSKPHGKGTFQNKRRPRKVDVNTAVSSKTRVATKWAKKWHDLNNGNGNGGNGSSGGNGSPGDFVGF